MDPALCSTAAWHYRFWPESVMDDAGQKFPRCVMIRLSSNKSVIITRKLAER